MSTAPEITVLMVHNVAASPLTCPGPLGQSCSTRHLDEVLEARKGCQKWDVGTLACYLRNGVPQPSRDVLVLTFDDGYRSFLTEALPVLERHTMPACLFVTTDFADGKVAYEIRLARMMAGDPESYNGIRSSLKKLPPAEREERMKALGSSPEIESPFLGWNEIKALSNHPLVTIGSHGVSHCLLPGQVQEVAESKRIIEKRLGIVVRHISYPYGGTSSGVRSEAGRHGYYLGFRARPGRGYWDRENRDSYSVPRQDIMGVKA